jgi:hypothetical protein
VLRIAATPSSLNSKAALEKVAARCGTDIAVVNDNGSENMGKAEKFLAAAEITQYWTSPCAPKEKPHIERFIGTFQRECAPTTLARLPLRADERHRTASPGRRLA